MSDDMQRVARTYDRIDNGEFRRGRVCRPHDMPADRRGKCPDCYRADDEYAETEADRLRLWRTR